MAPLRSSPTSTKSRSSSFAGAYLSHLNTGLSKTRSRSTSNIFLNQGGNADILGRSSSSTMSIGSSTSPDPSTTPAARGGRTVKKREIHNAIERDRRNRLNEHFLDLAAKLPATSSVRRPSKNLVINKSLHFVGDALAHEQTYRDIIARLVQENAALRDEVNAYRAVNSTALLPPAPDVVLPATLDEIGRASHNGSSRGPRTGASSASLYYQADEEDEEEDEERRLDDEDGEGVGDYAGHDDDAALDAWADSLRPFMRSEVKPTHFASLFGAHLQPAATTTSSAPSTAGGAVATATPASMPMPSFNLLPTQLAMLSSSPYVDVSGTTQPAITFNPAYTMQAPPAPMGAFAVGNADIGFGATPTSAPPQLPQAQGMGHDLPTSMPMPMTSAERDAAMLTALSGAAGGFHDRGPFRSAGLDGQACCSPRSLPARRGRGDERGDGDGDGAVPTPSPSAGVSARASPGTSPSSSTDSSSRSSSASSPNPSLSAGPSPSPSPRPDHDGASKGESSASLRAAAADATHLKGGLADVPGLGPGTMAPECLGTMLVLCA